MTLPSHLFVSSDGDIYNTRLVDWHKRPLRRKYSYPFREIRSVAQLKASLRYGEFTWPGCYWRFFMTADGEILSFEAVRNNYRTIVEAIRHNLTSSGWRIIASDSVELYDGVLHCDVTGKPLV